VVASLGSPQYPSSPTLCTQKNKGHCDCAQFNEGHIGHGGLTYTWYIDGTQRCITTYTGLTDGLATDHAPSQATTTTIPADCLACFSKGGCKPHTSTCDRCLDENQKKCAPICGPERIPFGEVHKEFCHGAPPAPPTPPTPPGPTPPVKPQATLMFLNCYGMDQLSGLNGAALDAADRFGLTTVYMSTPGGGWSWNTSVVNDTQPRDCSEASAGQDYTYFKEALDFIATLPFHDPARVYTYGFSQNGMGSAYVGRCFEEQVTGSWIGGGGLFALGHGPIPPNKAGTCQTPGMPPDVDGCKYWPVYPCHEAEKARRLQSCIQFYSNDPVTVDQQDPTHTKGHGLYLFERLEAEGNDARMVEFFPDENQGIEGGHSGPANGFDWLVSCFGGISPACSEKCESAMVECMKSSPQGGPGAYQHCLLDMLVRSGDCASGCTPSYQMLMNSEIPTRNLTVGAAWGNPAVVSPRPSASICEV